MKPNLLALVAAVFFITGGLFAQVPQAMNYQAIARNANGNILANTHINLQFTLNQGNNPGTPLYQETQAATTNQFGLFTCAIGQGTVVSGTFSGINWATGNIYLNIELDPSGGNNFVQMGESQLLSVPYAFYAQTAGGSVGATGATGATGADGAANAWGLAGNTGTVFGTNYVGTNDTADLMFKVNNQLAGYVMANNPAKGTAFGYQALSQGALGPAGAENAAFGYQALGMTTTGFENTAMGYQALYKNTNGMNNTAVGILALTNNNGIFNTAVGGGAQYYNTTGNQNTAFGASAMYHNSTGSGNTAVGGSSLANNYFGNNNTAIGYLADVIGDTLTNATAIGYNAKAFTNNSLILGSGANVGIGTGTPHMLLDVTSPVDTNGNAAIRGIATGTTNNVYGVMGITTGTGYAAAGVYGLTSVANASGVFGETRSGTNTAGVYGQADSSGWALFGYNNNLDGHGIALGAYLGGTGGIAVDANAGGGSAIAVSAISNSTLGTDTTIAGYFKATGGIANYALLVPAGGGKVGIGTATPATLLDVESTSSPAFKLNDGTQAAGRVLTSDANGNASWQTPGGGIQFFATSDTNTVVSQNAYSKIPFQDVRFNSGGAYNASTNYFTAPSGGLYHFDANLRLDGASGDQAYMYLRVNGGLNAGIFSTINSTGSANLIISTGLLLNAGDSVDIEVYSFSAGDHLFTENFGNTCYFSGYKVR